MADLQLGVLAESDNDCKVMRVLIRRTFEAHGVASRSFGLVTRAAGGCAKLQKGAERWLRDLAAGGCNAAILVQDLDRNPLSGALNDPVLLEHDLGKLAVPRGLARHICIPVEEIEAWFFSSEDVLKKICGRPQKAHPHPHLVVSPKETLERMSRDARNRPRYAVNNNHRYAEDLDLTECAKRCPAFAALQRFLIGLLPSSR